MENIHHKQSFWSKYIFSTDHKTIGTQYMLMYSGITWHSPARASHFMVCLARRLIMHLLPFME